MIYDTGCRRCQLSEGPRSAGRRVCVPGEGPERCDIMLLGRDPGANEEREGRPFVGNAGRVLDQMLSDAGLKRSDVYVSNIVRCRPPGNREPTAAEIAACRFFTIRELERVQPKVIIALGGVTAKELMGKSSIQDSRGKVFKLRGDFRYDCSVIVTYHPAAGLHAPHEAKRMRDAIASDLRAAVRLVDVTDEVETATSLEPRRAIAALKAIAKATEVACDLEWTVTSHGGSYPWSKRKGRAGEIIAMGLAANVDGKIVSVSVQAEGPMFEAAKRIVSRIPSIYHTAPADLPWLLAQGVTPTVRDDTILLASLINIEHSLSLEALAGAYTEMPPGWKTETSVRDWTRAPVTAEGWHALLTRNALDAHATLLLRDALLLEATKRDRTAVLPLYRELLRVERSLSRTALNGVPIDEEKLERVAENTRKRLHELKQEIADDLQVPTFATGGKGSGEAIGHALIEAGVPLPLTPKQHKPSVKMEYLTPHVDKHRAVTKMIRLVKLTKLYGTYFKPWKFLMEQQGDGRLHTSYKLWVARSGRTSVEHDTGGTLQQFPRNDSVRSLIKAREGWSILSADEGQIELRVGAWIANEQNLIRFLRDGIDPHKAIVAWVNALGEGITVETFLSEIHERTARIGKDERQRGKPINFGFEYGMRENGFIRTSLRDYGVRFTMAQATTARNGYFTLYPGFAQWHRDAWRWVELGYVDSPFGRRRYLSRDSGDDDEALHRQAINTPCQATSSDIPLISLPEIEDDLYDALVFPEHCITLGFIHDALMFEVRDEHIDVVAECVKYHMENPPFDRLGVDFTVPLEVEVKVGKTWGDSVVWKPK